MSIVRPAPAGGIQSGAAVRGLCREALQLRSALDMECWSSSLLGQIWEQRRAAPPIDGLDQTFVLGAPLIEQIGRYGGPGARLTLEAVARVDQGGIGARARQLAGRLPAQSLPDWARHRGRVTVCRALTTGVPGDGELIWLEASGGGRDRHTVSVFVDLMQDGIAKHIHLLAPIDRLARDAFGRDRGLGTRPVRLAPAQACERAVEAIRRTDECEHPVLGDTFAELRALALARGGTRAGARVDGVWLN